MNVLYLNWQLFPMDYGGALASAGFVKHLSSICSLNVISFYHGDTFKPEVNTSHPIFDKVNSIQFIPFRKRDLTIHENNNRAIRVTKTAINTLVINRVNKRAWNAEMEMAIDEVIAKNQIKKIIFDEYFMSVYFSKCYKKYGKTLKYCVIEHNAEFYNAFEFYRSEKKLVSRLIAYLRYLQVKSFEYHMQKNMDQIFLLTSTDRTHFQQSFRLNREYLIFRTMPYLKAHREREDSENFNKRILFVGNMWWYPNVSAVNWFIDHVFIKLIEIDPQYKFTIVGKAPTDELLKRIIGYEENIIITGYVDDVGAYYRQCDIAIIPIFEGSGTKIKLLESINEGIPTLVSSYCSKDIEDNGTLVICDEPEDYLREIQRLATDQEERLRLFDRSKELYRKYDRLDETIINAIRK